MDLRILPLSVIKPGQWSVVDGLEHACCFVHAKSTPTNLPMRLRNSFGVAVIFLTSVCVSSACSKAQQPSSGGGRAVAAQSTQAPLSPQERQLYMDAARSS